MTILPRIFSPVMAADGIHQRMNFQGKVVNDDGTNVANGNYDMVFKLYTVSSGGTADWTETWNSGSSQVAVTDGVFQLELGTHTSLASFDFNADTWYLGVNFNGDGEMLPRIRLTSVPYAFNAKTVAGLTVQDSGGGADTSGTLKVADSSTLTFVADFTMSGANALTLTTTGTTNVTLPTTGTLATLAGSEIFTNKTIGSTGLTFSGASTDITTAGGEALVLNGNAASTIQTSAGEIIVQAAGTGTISRLQIGAGGSGSSTPDYLGLDVKSDTGDPAGGAEGYMYYNTADNLFRCYQNTGWTNCIGSGGTPVWSGIQSPSDNLSLTMAAYNSTFSWDPGANGVETAFTLNFDGEDSSTDDEQVLLALIQTANGTDVTEAADALLTFANSDADDPVENGLRFDAGAAGTDFTYGLNFDAASFGTAELVLQNSELIANTADGAITLTGVGQTNNGALTFDLETNTIPTFTSSTDTAIGIDEDLTFIGAQTINTTAGNLTLASGGTTVDVDDILNANSITSDAGVTIAASQQYTGLGAVTLASADASTLTINSGTTGTINFGTDTSDETINIGTGGAVKGLIIGSTNTTSSTVVQSGTAGITFQTGGTGDFIFSADADTNLQLTAGAAPGVDIMAITNAGQGTTTSTVDGLDINFTAATDGAGDTNAGAHITITDSGDSGDTLSGLQITAGTASAGTQYGINIENITGGGGTEYALVIGTGWDRGLSVGSASTFTSTLTSEDTVTIGTGGNTFTFNPASGPLYAGAARPSITTLISAEYGGATLTANGSSNTSGGMISDIVLDADLGWMNYYDWSSTTVSPIQDYTVAVKVTLPSNFDQWETSNALQINFATEYTDNAKNKIDVVIKNMTESPSSVVAQSLTNVSSPAADWETITIDDSDLDNGSAPDWDAAGETAVFFITMYSLRDASNCTGGSDNGCYVRVGDIKLNYKAKF
jgi:hypothetical protein